MSARVHVPLTSTRSRLQHDTPSDEQAIMAKRHGNQLWEIGFSLRPARLLVLAALCIPGVKKKQKSNPKVGFGWTYWKHVSLAGMADNTNMFASGNPGKTLPHLSRKQVLPHMLYDQVSIIVSESEL